MKKYISIILSLVLLSSCGDFLEEYSQDQYYVQSWKDLNELLVGSGYVKYEYQQSPTSWGQSHIGSFIHFLSDEMGECVSGPSVGFDEMREMFGYYTWQQRPGIDETLSTTNTENYTWKQCYYHINVCNNIINSLEDVPNVTEEEHQGYHKVSGEAHFIRAFLYFFLTNVYGKPYKPETCETDLAVPLKTSPNVEDIKYGRNTVKEAYDLITEDIEKAIYELTQYKAAQPSIYRADSVAAFMLASRIYLYKQDWENSLKYSNKVIARHPDIKEIANNTYGTFNTSDNPEHIFSMGSNDTHKIFDYGAQNFAIPYSSYLIYDRYDYRRTQWFWNMGTFVGITKLPVGNLSEDAKVTYGPQSSLFYNMNYYHYAVDYPALSAQFGLRSSEAYINKAEALTYLGREDEARKVINYFKSFRYSSASENYTEKASGAELAENIRMERRKEFFLEGHRWFDLRRYAVNTVYPKKTTLQHEYTVYRERGQADIIERHRYTLTEDDPSWTVPIPFEVLDFNEGMPDNGALVRTYELVPLNTNP